MTPLYSILSLTNLNEPKPLEFLGTTQPNIIPNPIIPNGTKKNIYICIYILIFQEVVKSVSRNGLDLIYIMDCPLTLSDKRFVFNLNGSNYYY